MKATLEFSLPEEEPDFRAALDAQRLVSAMDHIRNVARTQLKHGEPTVERLTEALQRILTTASEHT